MTSTIKVNTVKDTASTDIIKKCGTSITVGTASDTTTVAGNAVRSNALQASDGQNIISQTGTTITLGASGDTIALSAGANQTGFGRTGTVDWNTTPKTATFTSVSGDGFFANTSGGAFTMNLPAGVAGAIVSVADYAGTWQTNALTVSPNGTDKIGSVNTSVTLDTEGQSVTFVFVDSTQGWINTMDSTSNVRGNAFIVATGGTITCSGNFKIHTFTGPGTFAVSNTAACASDNKLDYLVVAGGGGTGGKTCQTGAAGAGGFRVSNDTCMPAPLTSPLANPTGLTATVASFPITVGGGGAPRPAPGGASPGSNSIFSTITSTGGGGGTGNAGGGTGDPGGSGGGARCGTAGSGNTPPVSPSQGNPGGNGVHSPPEFGTGGGGGAATAGGPGGPGGVGNGGVGSFVVETGFAGSNGTPGPVSGAKYFSGGGGGGSETGAGTGGTGGGGAGANNSGSATGGTTNTGGGAGSGNNADGDGAGGGSGIVIIRYKFQ